MKTLLCLFAVAALLCGCASATNGRRKLAADKLSQIHAGVTTRAEMFQWFGPPVTQTFDAGGKLIADWQYREAFASPFNVVVKSQLLSAIFNTNNVVERFSLADDVNPQPGQPKELELKTPRPGKGQ